MKIRNLLFASAFAFAFTSCSNSDDIPSTPSTSISGDVKISVDVSSISTRIKDQAVNDGDKSSINSADVYLLEGETGPNQKVHSSFTFTDEELIELRQSNYIIEKINGNITGLALVTNKKKTNERAANGTPLSNLEVSTFQSTIADIQPSAENMGVSNAPMFGSASSLIESGSNPVTSNKLYTANVTLVPNIARVQLYGMPKHSSRIKNLKVTKIFIDNFNTKSFDETEKFNVGKASGTDLDAKLATYDFFDINDNGLKLSETKENIYAYHLYPQIELTEVEKPKDRGVKLILEMQYDIVDQDQQVVKEKVTEYATLRFATIKSGSNTGKGDASLNDEFVAIEAANVYTINLGVIDWTGDGEYVDPEGEDVEDKDKDEFNPGDGGETPNADQKDLKVAVTIQDWTEVLIIPQN